MIDTEELQRKKKLPGDLHGYNPNENNIKAVLQEVNELPQSSQQINGRNEAETGISINNLVSNKFQLRNSNKDLIHDESVEINDSPANNQTLKYIQGGITPKATEQNGWRNVLPEGIGMENGPSQDTGTNMVAGLASDKKQAFGEMGQPVNINVDKLNQTERERYQALFKRNYFNEYASEKISLHRTLPDKRDESCLTKVYGRNLPDTAIIICFHNEAWSTLLRTVHSVLDRSPPHLVREIILIDDFSNLDHLKAPLDNYVSTLPKVRLIRLPQREGLIRARLVGYRNATAPVLTFLDSHVECLIGWLEPLLFRISETKSRLSVVFPTLDNIDDITLEYGEAVIDMVGAFHWKDMTFTWVKVPRDIWDIRKEMAEPLRSPTMPGGIFSIDKEYFTTLGTYDPGLETWGGENLELSFKIWMCGGTLEMIPCSRVAHIFRTASPYSWPNGSVTSWRNVVRVAKVWMDEYQNFFFDFYKVKLNTGDLSSRQKLRNNLNCKNFSWYAETILKHYMYIPTDALTVGEIRAYNLDGCLDSCDRHGILKLYQCHGNGGNQNWYYTESGLVRTEVRLRKESEGCLSFNLNQPTIDICNRTDPKQIYKYTQDMMLLNVFSKTCITIGTDVNTTLYLTPCQNTHLQKWLLKPRAK
ncbi:hypothetical protein SNE40_023544 [Patella caerulea]|uniref:Polypeptide N-acetylgalactosaminyltransferase n=1 Tax=Patella caerulea TaxID=87958 RepID=A0AAN8IW88_PATCE